MNSHDEFDILLSAALDGELTPDEQARLDAHLHACGACRAALAQYSRLSSHLKTAWPNESLSPDLEARLAREHNATQREDTMKRSTFNWKKATAALTVCGFVTVSVMAVNSYVQRGLQARLKSATDDIGGQYGTAAPGEKKAGTFYEPYYLATESDADKRKGQLAATILPASKIAMSSRKQEFWRGESRTAAASREIVSTEAVGAFGDIAIDDVWSPPEPLPHPGRVDADFHTEAYDRIYENPFLAARENPLSTFSIDVDTASYSNVRRFLTNGQLPPADAVRIEELVNYFVYDYPQPKGDAPFSITTEVAPAPWNPQHQLMLIGLQGKELTGEATPPSNLVFLIDVSGSMNDPNKLPLLKSAFRMMVNQLQPGETVSIVTYAGSAGLVLPPTSGRDKAEILAALDRLNAGGSTAGGAGLRLAYTTAQEQFIEGGNNRVILATDGDFNVGVSSDAEMVRLIEEHRNKGIFLTVLGFGTSNYKDAKMEKIADHGNGNYYYIDTLNEAKKVLVDELGSTLFTIAKDVKLQLEFNPARVQAYRLIGYENRLLDKENFNDDTKDAGELGAGHTVTALYELVPAGADMAVPGVDPLKYQTVDVVQSSDLVTVKLRYKQPDSDTSQLISRVLTAEDVESVETVSENFRFASAVAEFGLLLRHSQFKGSASFDAVTARARSAQGADPYGYRAEFLTLVQQAAALTPQSGGGYRTK